MALWLNLSNTLQEVDGTGLYLSIIFQILDDKSSDADLLSEAESRFVGLAERVLGEASALQTDHDDSTRTHETLGLKAPVTVQVRLDHRCGLRFCFAAPSI
jgi:hypothetical protein